MYMCVHIFLNIQICLRYLLKCGNSALAAPCGSSLSTLCSEIHHFHSYSETQKHFTHSIQFGYHVVSFIVKKAQNKNKKYNYSIRKENYHLFQVIWLLT